MEDALAELKLLSTEGVMDKHVVFVHGLRRVNSQVWMSSGAPPELWPLWLQKDIPNLGIWSLEHDSAPTDWRGWSMHHTDRARNLLALLLSESRLRQGDIYFVVHSFGGVIVEQLLRTSDSRKSQDQNVANMLRRIRRVAFLGTPHLGADLATWAGRLRLLARPSSAVKDLARNDPNLRDLNLWYRHYASENGIETLTLFETRKTGWLGHIVKPDSADPGLPSDPIGVDADHYGIWSPADTNSEIYRHVRDFLKPDVKAAHRDALIADAMQKQSTSIDALATSTDQNTAALERIERRLTSDTLSQAASPIPQGLVDDETDRRIWLLRKSRLFGGADHIQGASRLARDLIEGELVATSKSKKSTSLAWCARILLGRPDRSEALRVLEAAHALDTNDEVRIAEALQASYEGDLSGALGKLASINTAQARTASFIVVAKSREPADALAWLQQTGWAFADLDPDGKFFLLKKQLDASQWAQALQSAELLNDADFNQAPCLYYVAGGAHLVQAVPDELRAFVLWNLPFDAAPFPLAADSEALNERRAAQELYAKAADAATSLGCIRAGNEASDRALWLGLRGAEGHTAARATLEASMRDPAHSLRRLALALQFGLKLDLHAVEQEIERQSAVSGGESADAALARFAIAFTKKGPREVAEYIDKHRQQLVTHLNPNFVASVEIQVLAQSGQIQLAEARIKELSDPQQTIHGRSRLARIIAEAKGTDPVDAREAQFKSSDSLTDLANLIELLEERKDFVRLAQYGRIYFERTHDLPGCRTVVQALYELGNHAEVVKLLRAHPDLVRQSDHLESMLAWSYYHNGEVADAAQVLAKLRSKRDDANDRILTINLAITSGNWNALLAFTEQEWEKRRDRDAADFLRAGQLAHHLGSARAKSLIFVAAGKANGDPAILLGCYGVAVSAGWEDNADVFSWLERAAALSGEDGPVQRVSMKELFDRQPAWQQRETQTWEQLHAGALPIFAAAHLLNRSLVDMFLLPALANPTQLDPRRRGVVYTYSGARGAVQGVSRTVALDPTALMTFGLLGVLEKVLGWFDKVVIPHSTIAWLFDERQRIQFHQPSKVADALEIKRLLDGGDLQRFEPTAAPDSELAAEVGDELAAMIAEAAADSSEGHRQRLVVRSSPVHRIGSLMEEEADLNAHAQHLRGCLDVVEALKLQGQLTQAEEQRARAYLSLREKPWPGQKAIEAGAILYLDELSVSFLQHLRLLPRIRRAGFTAIVPPSEIAQGDGYIRYNSLAKQAVDHLEDLRRVLADGIASGKIRLAASVKTEATQDDRLKQHPTFAVLEIVKDAEAIVIDDRYFNQHGNIQGEFGRKPVWTSFDILTTLEQDRGQQNEYLTAMRRAGLCYVPLTGPELESLIARAPVVDESLVETAELKAIREGLLIARMMNGLQLPKEHVWLDNVIGSILHAIRAQWHVDMDEQIAKARSVWLLDQLDIRGWAHRLMVEGHPNPSDIRYRGQILVLGTLLGGAKVSVKRKYWEWLEESLLARIQEEDRELFDAIVNHVRGLTREAAQRQQPGDANG